MAFPRAKPEQSCSRADATPLHLQVLNPHVPLQRSHRGRDPTTGNPPRCPPVYPRSRVKWADGEAVKVCDVDVLETNQRIYRHGPQSHQAVGKGRCYPFSVRFPNPAMQATGPHIGRCRWNHVCKHGTEHLSPALMLPSIPAPHFNAFIRLLWPSPSANNWAKRNWPSFHGV